MVETQASKMGANVTNQFQSVLYTDLFIFIVLMVLYTCLRGMFIDFEARRKYGRDPKSGITYPKFTPGLGWLTYMLKMSHTEFYYHCGIDALVIRMFLGTCVRICLLALPFSLIILVPIYGTGERQTSDALAAVSLPNVADESLRMWASAIAQWYLVIITLYEFSTLYLRLAFICDNYNCGNHFFNDFIHKITWRSFLKMDITQDCNSVQARPSQRHKFFDMHMPHRHKDRHHNDIDHNDMNTKDEKAKRAAAAKHNHKHREELDSEKWSKALAHLPVRSNRLTIMVSELPPYYRNLQLLWKMMDELFPGEILRVTIVPDVREITKLDEQVVQYEKELERLEKKQESHKKPIKKRMHCCGLCGRKVDVADYDRKEIERLTSEIREKLPNLKTTSFAFVQFTNMTAANFFLSAPLRFGVIEARTLLTPRPEDILWTQMAYERNEIRVSRVIVAICMVLLLMFWTIPVTALQSLAHLRDIFQEGGINLENYLPAAFLIWLEGYLSIFLLNAWLHLIPIIVDKLAERERWVTIGDHRISCLIKYFDCLLFMLVFVTSISGTVIQSLESTGWDAIEVIRLLGIGLSKMSTYFMMYLLNLALFQIPFQLFRVGYWFKRWVLGKDEHNFDYWDTYPLLMIGLLLCVTYGAMSPLIWIIGLLFFGMMYLVLSYQLSMCFINYHECGLELWPSIFLRLMCGVEIGNVTLIALLALKQAIGPAVLVFILAIVVYFFSKSLHDNYADNFYKTDIRTARKFDIEQRIQDANLAQKAKLDKLDSDELPVPEKPVPMMLEKKTNRVVMREPSMSEQDNRKKVDDHEAKESRQEDDNKIDHDHEEKMAVEDADRSVSDDTRRMEEKKLLKEKDAREAEVESNSSRDGRNQERDAMKKHDQNGVDDKKERNEDLEAGAKRQPGEHQKLSYTENWAKLQPFKDRKWDREYIPPVVRKYAKDDSAQVPK